MMVRVCHHCTACQMLSTEVCLVPQRTNPIARQHPPKVLCIML